MSANDEGLLISGLTALKTFLEVFEYEVEEDRGPLNEMVAIFFPILEQHIQNVVNSQSPN